MRRTHRQTPAPIEPLEPRELLSASFVTKIPHRGSPHSLAIVVPGTYTIYIHGEDRPWLNPDYHPTSMWSMVALPAYVGGLGSIIAQAIVT